MINKLGLKIPKHKCVVIDIPLCYNEIMSYTWPTLSEYANDKGYTHKMVAKVWELGKRVHKREFRNVVEK